MPRLAESPVRPLRAGDGSLKAIALGRRRLRVVRALERWRESGEWWEGEQEREVTRLLLADGAVVEVSAPPGGGDVGWRLEAWFD
jgi:hypothetical protein